MNKEEYFERIKQFSSLAKKEIGQNFLIDSSVCERICKELEIKEGESVLEIGCGAGSLTYCLSLTPGKIETIDIDEAMLTKVQEDFKGNQNVKVSNGNAMRWDYSHYDKIVGNLPYYITSGIVEKVLLGADKAKRCVFMVQKEAAERLLAKQGSKDYGPLPILIALSGKASYCFKVGRGCFAPAPHVDSAVIKIELDHAVENIEGVYRLSEKLFLQRRKTLFNNLKAYLNNADLAKDLLEGQSISLLARAEDLSPMQFLHLCEAIKTSRISKPL